MFAPGETRSFTVRAVLYQSSAGVNSILGVAVVASRLNLARPRRPYRLIAWILQRRFDFADVCAGRNALLDC